MRDLTDELMAIRQEDSDNKHQWSVREILAVIRPGRILWSRVSETLHRTMEQATLQGTPNLNEHIVCVQVQPQGKPHYSDCKVSGYGAYLFCSELRPSDSIRAALAYFSRYAIPTIPPPIDAPAATLIELPPLSLRDRLNMAMRSYAGMYALEYSEAWNKLYMQHRYRFKEDIKAKAKNAEKKTLDWAEENGKLEELLAIANYLIEPKKYSHTPLAAS
jgi:hypothetical protein